MHRHILCFSLGLLLSCTEGKTELASDPPGVLVDAAVSAQDAAARQDAASAPIDAGPPRLCKGNKPCECDNGKDDDDDGLVDGFDPECTGGFDDDEGSFATGLMADELKECLDCFFDDNAGLGDDGCAYPRACLFDDPPADAVGEELVCQSCTVSEACVDNCLPRTPNGCDCFGCCEVWQADGRPLSVLAQADCDSDSLDDDKACPPCVQNPDCLNPCGECELCPGRTADDLPRSCGDGGRGGEPGFSCDDGEALCDADSPCTPGYYCQQGCCLPEVL